MCHSSKTGEYTTPTKIVFIECSKCKKQIPIGNFCIECGEKNTVEFLDYRVKSKEEANPVMIRICSHCNIDSKNIEGGGGQFDNWSKCSNCGKMNPKTIAIKLSDYNKLIIIKQ